MAARTRSGADLIDDALKRGNNEETDDTDGRHPRPKVLRYLNQGGAELWDLLIEARGSDYFRKVPAYTITTDTDTTSYDLPLEFYLLVSVRLDGEYGATLTPFTAQEEPYLRAPDISLGLPTSYQLRRSSAGTDFLEVLPLHDADRDLVVEYVPAFTDVTDSALSLFYGFNGWEEYLVCYAVRELATEDDEWPLVKAMEMRLAQIADRIRKLAPKRDLHRARRVTDVRNGRMMSRRWW